MAKQTDIVKLKVNVSRSVVGKSYIELRLTLHERLEGKQTIDHRTVNKYVSMGISGAFRDKEVGQSFGQCQDLIRSANLSKRQTPEITIKRILVMWDAWHLNDMDAGCEHQSPVEANLDPSEWRMKADIENEKCPNKYRYGTNWLLAELPKTVVEDVLTLFGGKMEDYPELVELYTL